MWKASETGELRQGELLAGLWLPRPLLPTAQYTKPNQRPLAVEIKNVKLKFAVVMQNDCDLKNHYNALATNRDNPAFGQVLFCGGSLRSQESLQSEAERIGVPLSIIVNQQLPRFHLLDPPPGVTESVLVDFKTVALAYAAALYEGCTYERRGVLDSPWRDEIVQRFYSYQSRVALPDPPVAGLAPTA